MGDLSTSDFDYELPAGRIARYPVDVRSDSRLLVLDAATGGVRHLWFRDLPALMDEGDVAVVNDTRVIPARLVGRKPTGARAEVLLLRPARSGYGDGGGAGGLREWEALVRPGGKLKPGRRVEVADELAVRILDSAPGGGRIVRLETPLPVEEALERFGHVPLPPYLEREDEPLDRVRYQTVYGRADGSVAAPTAGLHFTDELVREVVSRGVDWVPVTLHVGVGTFRPVDVEDPEEHEMHPEAYSVSHEAARRIEVSRAAGGRVWAVGTTVVRTLESVAGDDGRVTAGSGDTSLFIKPPFTFRAVDRLVTNFHLPRSTLLMLVAAFGGRESVLAAYAEAVEAGYRFYSYGDAMAVIR